MSASRSGHGVTVRIKWEGKVVREYFVDGDEFDEMVSELSQPYGDASRTTDVAPKKAAKKAAKK